MPDCAASYWQYSAWGACNATCGGGYAFRSATCVSKAGGACGSQPHPTTMRCNTQPCQVFTWSAGPWGDCSADCGGGWCLFAHCLHGACLLRLIEGVWQGEL